MVRKREISVALRAWGGSGRKVKEIRTKMKRTSELTDTAENTGRDMQGRNQKHKKRRNKEVKQSFFFLIK